VPIVHDESGDGLCLDAILLDPREIAVLFAFSRAYFMVDIEVPSAYVEFLASMLPGKPRAELYTSLGLQKHGKTLFYRDFLHHLKHSTDAFVIAPGIRGLVMIVFTLPSYPYVFKVIRDTISPIKNIDRQTVKDKYLLVKRHDRVGRMADTLEYTDVAFPRSRFDPALIAELEREVPSLVEEEDDTLIVKHLYIERRMTPLNLYLDQGDEQQVRQAVREYGSNAIRELASVNIFPGDMLFKNFGVTRGGKVVFYDYDEIEYLTDCNFRKVPTPRNEEDEMSGEVWYSVGPKDVFPETFAPFLLGNPAIREVFMAEHADLLDPAFWQGHKQEILAGYVHDVFPYEAQKRFATRRGPSRIWQID
jgi:isocitrate dehydrogenase kinase/phosphatase